MKYLALVSLLFIFSLQANEGLSCDESINKPIGKLIGYDNATLKVRVTGKPCHEANLNLEISVGENIIYSYNSPFKQHIAVHWADVTSLDVTGFIKHISENYNFTDCAELPSISQGGELPYYSDLIISSEDYLNFKSSSCKVYIHTFEHYEGNRVLVFPQNNNN